MRDKGFTDSIRGIDTPNDTSFTEKPLESQETTFKRVDINILKSKLKENQKKENKKNINLFVLFFTAIGSLGLYLSA